MKFTPYRVKKRGRVKLPQECESSFYNRRQEAEGRRQEVKLILFLASTLVTMS
jgi:hypothetical protein